MIRPFPVVQLKPVDPLPSQRFRDWVRQYGVTRLSRSLAVDRITIHAWVRPEFPRLPLLDHIRSMIGLSQVEMIQGEPLSYEDFFGDVRVKKTTVFEGRGRA